VIGIEGLSLDRVRAVVPFITKDTKLAKLTKLTRPQPSTKVACRFVSFVTFVMRRAQKHRMTSP
jgi:hypothetical protein